MGQYENQTVKVFGSAGQRQQHDSSCQDRTALLTRTIESHLALATGSFFPPANYWATPAGRVLGQKLNANFTNKKARCVFAAGHGPVPLPFRFKSYRLSEGVMSTTWSLWVVGSIVAITFTFLPSNCFALS